MTYKVFTGPPGPRSAGKGPLAAKADLDQALAWAQHAKQKGLVPLLIEGDDGTSLDRKAVATALAHREHESSPQ